jgi:hypothetical protein
MSAGTQRFRDRRTEMIICTECGETTFLGGKTVTYSVCIGCASALAEENAAQDEEERLFLEEARESIEGFINRMDMRRGWGEVY